MRDSSTFMAILEEGKVEQAHKVTRELGADFLGKIRKKDRDVLKSITDLTRLDRMVLRVHKAADWADLLSTP